MGIELKIYQEKANGRGEDRSILAASGEIRVEDAIIWLVNDYSPGQLANHVSGDVKLIERNRLVISHTYYTGQFIPGVVEVDDFDGWDQYWWRYEFTGIIDPSEPWYNHELGYSSDFQQLKNLIWTFAKAWGLENPEALGTVIEQLTALQNQPV